MNRDELSTLTVGFMLGFIVGLALGILLAAIA